jgi:hypothetical protein
MNYPKAIKAFYMRVNDDGRTVAAMDVLAPGIANYGDSLLYGMCGWLVGRSLTPAGKLLISHRQARSQWDVAS